MAYYLMEEVGVPCRAANISRVEAISALAAIHTRGIIHGDTRLGNLVAVNNGKDLKWIDVRDTSFEVEGGRRESCGFDSAGPHLSLVKRLPLEVRACARAINQCICERYY